MKDIHNFKDFLNFYCEKNNDNIYYLSDNKGKKLNYLKLLDILKKFNLFINKKNIKKNSKILVILDNSIELLITFLSTIYSNRIFVPINPNSGDDEIKYIVNKVRPDFLITNKNYNKKINKIKNIKRYNINYENLLKDLKRFQVSKFDEDFKIKNNSIAQILFTSGSTGKPKGVVLTHKSMISNLYGIHKSLSIKTIKPKFLSVTPLYHNNGQFIPTLLPFILNGSTISISPETSLINFWPTCAKYKINYSSVMATHINYFNTQKKIRNHSLISLFCGGAKLDEFSQKTFEKKFRVKVLCNYGLTETSSIATTESLLDNKFYYGSVGKPLTNNKIKIVKKNLKYGEIWIKGENIFKQYFGEKKLTNEKFNNYWFKTGDLGYFNKENFLFIKDRIDNMIIVSGENIYPSEIENHVYNYKKLKIGIVSSIPDNITQNKLVFLYEGKKKIKDKDFYNFLKSKIARYKIPKIIVHVSDIGMKEIPKAPNKKILRSKIKNLLRLKLFK